MGSSHKKNEDSPTNKAILVDEHGGQIKGLAKYFHEKSLMVMMGKDILFDKLINKGVDKGTSYINEHID